jgi:hypothetical protein
MCLLTHLCAHAVLLLLMQRARLSKEALEKARAEQQRQQLGQLGASPAGSCADIRRSPV